MSSWPEPYFPEVSPEFRALPLTGKVPGPRPLRPGEVPCVGEKKML